MSKHLAHFVCRAYIDAVIEADNEDDCECRDVEGARRRKTGVFAL